MSYDLQREKGAARPAPSEELALSALSLDPHDWALFLDIDGTLLDLAETPESIVVPASLPFDLGALSQKLGGALALVTGRSLSFVDPLFSPFRFPVAGLHGAERRDAAGHLTRVPISADFAEMKRAIAVEAERWAGVLVEDKGAAVAAHYRLAPEYRAEVEAMMQRYFAKAGPDWALQHGKMVVEIRPARADKGQAVEAFLAEAPFKGRRPLAIGDDVTDEAMFHAVNRVGGHSLRVGSPGQQTHARGLISSPAILRRTISTLVS
ncbi:trehalose-phosphatase [Rhizobium tubonense]|uniref:Trehalose 6-phosphate phosphatase n=1 Tax=Rhizobium tubonense TaxID=484088 RepID=A0A2W4CGH9_9HYPH|nr:trehalose-phosphatase [Rhizobium tubonense]PZM12217.1 trehalose-phosphatase [Rhizobium tubonense]